MGAIPGGGLHRAVCSSVACQLLGVLCLLTMCGIAQSDEAAIRSRVRGMLLGSLIGDAAGGPVEFKSNDELNRWLPNLRAMTADEYKAWAGAFSKEQRFKLLPYAGIRDEIAPYGPWEEQAAAGTITDDSRHKAVLLSCMRDFIAAADAGRETANRMSDRSLAKAYIDYGSTFARRGKDRYAALAVESFTEYVAAARWILGERNLAVANPPQRLWSGIATCSGQMTLLPLAAIYPGDADSAYRAAYAMGFVDVGTGKDINAMLVAGLASAIGDGSQRPEERWANALEAMRTTDPYRYADVPFAGRPATQWLAFAIDAANRADGVPARLFDILEKEGRAKYYWDAHFTFASAIACLQFAKFNTLEAMTVSLAFGHDTDSAAQVIGALGGAVEGESVFPVEAKQQVARRLKEDYGEEIQEWTQLLVQLQDRDRFPNPVRFVESTE